MLVSEKGQVTIPKHIRSAAGVVPGSEVSFSLDGRKIIITPVAGAVKNDRRAKLRAAAAKVRSTLSPEFRQLGAQEIMDFLRGEDTAAAKSRRARR
jgi:AbrB family looped-hinge helix DNA binding protein